MNVLEWLESANYFFRCLAISGFEISAADYGYGGKVLNMMHGVFLILKYML